MKVLLFSAEWPEYMVELANGLSKKCDVTLMLPSNYGFVQKHKDCLSNSVRLIEYKLIDYKSIRQNFKMLVTIIRVIRSLQPDILHIQANGHPLFYWVAILKPAKTKIVNTIHDPVKHSGDWLSSRVDDSAIVRAMRRFTKKYIVHGEKMIGELVIAYNVDRRKVVSIPHGHFEIYRKLQEGTAVEREFTALFFGRIWRYKGLEYFIKAANIVHQKDRSIRFCIAGTGEEIGKYLDMMVNKEAFRIINKRIPIEEVGLLFQQASVVVLPYLDATQSGVIPLAYGFGKPVIATTVGALPEVVRHNETGFLVRPESEEEIADRIIYLKNHPGDKARMGEAAYNFAHTELSWDRIASMTISVYSSL